MLTDKQLLSITGGVTCTEAREQMDAHKRAGLTRLLQASETDKPERRRELAELAVQEADGYRSAARESWKLCP